MIAPAQSFTKATGPSRRLDARSDSDREVDVSKDLPAKLQHATGAMIQSQPVASLFVAATAGLILGWLVKRKWGA